VVILQRQIVGGGTGPTTVSTVNGSINSPSINTGGKPRGGVAAPGLELVCTTRAFQLLDYILVYTMVQTT